VEQNDIKGGKPVQGGKIFLTGGSGFVGYHLIKEAVARGYEIYAAVRKSSQVDHLKEFPVHFVYPDFNKVEALQAELEARQYDFIIHAAAATRAASQEAFNAANADITRNLAQAAINAAIPLKKFVFVSSLAVLGPVAYDAAAPIAEHNTPQPITGYGRSKLLAEKYLSEIKELPSVTLRPTVVYGPREKDLYVMFRTLSKGLEPYIGGKNQLLSFVYVADLVDVILNALEIDTPPGLVCNISDGHSYNRNELAIITKRILNRKTFRFHVPVGVVRALASLMEALYSRSKKTPLLYRERVGELTAPNWNCSIVNAQKYLNYQPQYNLEKGITESLKWYKENKWL
jgi:nucleoside-diphosphate-sugar epimerase